MARHLGRKFKSILTPETRGRKCGLLRRVGGLERVSATLRALRALARLAAAEILYWRARMVFGAPFRSFAACVELLKAKVRAAQCEMPSSVS